MRVAAACFVALACALRFSGALAVAELPPMGWSTWNTFRYNVTETLIQQTADTIAASRLASAGYSYILIDDGWTDCSVYREDGGCEVQAPRDSEGRIPVDPRKFPSGMAALADYVHSKGLKIGIYTAVSAKTCGGFSSSLGYEEIDARTFAEWGMDFIKHDTCNYDCGIHDGCMQNSTRAMRKGIDATGRPIVYYVDSGNPTSGPRVYNPTQAHETNKEALAKVATRYQDLVWFWGRGVAHMFKSWFDIYDDWSSVLTNLHNQVRVEMYQSCGTFNMPDMLTVGMGAMTQGQYRAQMFLWAALGAPLILGCDVRKMDAFTQDLLTAPEVLAVDQDPLCVQASMVQATGAGEVWIKPLADGSYAVVLLNKADVPQNVTVHIDTKYNWGDFYPASFATAHVRDLYARRDLGVFGDVFTALVDAMDAVIVKVTPLS